MNWLVIAILSWVIMGMERGLRDAVQLGAGAVAPSFLIVLVVYVAAWSRRQQALVFAMVVGIVADLLGDHTASSGDALTVLGPWALGLPACAYAASIMRAWMVRSNVIALGVMCALAGFFAEVVGLAILKAHNFGEPLALGSAWSELLQRMGIALYTGVAAIPLGLLLNVIRPWAFPASVSRGY